jgi:hypothetical protein
MTLSAGERIPQRLALRPQRVLKIRDILLVGQRGSTRASHRSASSLAFASARLFPAGAPARLSVKRRGPCYNRKSCTFP